MTNTRPRLPKEKKTEDEIVAVKAALKLFNDLEAAVHEEMEKRKFVLPKEARKDD